MKRRCVVADSADCESIAGYGARRLQPAERLCEPVTADPASLSRAVDDRRAWLTGLPLTGLSGSLLKRIAGMIFREPVFVDQGFTSEVRRGKGEPFECDPAVLAVRVERFPSRQV
jgi:hypothetical protein